jgi:hypothetical protein
VNDPGRTLVPASSPLPANIEAELAALVAAGEELRARRQADATRKATSRTSSTSPTGAATWTSATSQPRREPPSGARGRRHRGGRTHMDRDRAGQARTEQDPSSPLALTLLEGPRRRSDWRIEYTPTGLIGASACSHPTSSRTNGVRRDRLRAVLPSDERWRSPARRLMPDQQAGSTKHS